MLFDHDTEEADHFAVCRIFIHVDAAHDPDRETDDTASDDQVEGSDDRRKIPPFVIPSSGAFVRKSQLITLPPLMMMKPKITNKIATTR